jgi:sialic acid synthase SpsE
MYRELFGDGSLHLETQVAAIQNARRRIIARTDLAAGHVLTEGDLIALRSNVGIEIYDWDTVVGRTLKTAVSADEPITREALS